ncbi:MAG: dephospho-CoA kinase [Deltaproteobacteria bacterium]|nr:dephospho-CoA kinase [Deltaproteobacteria bacterium]
MRKESRKTFGLTGSIGTGKTTVADIFEELGAVIIDVDQVTREVIAPGTFAFNQVVESFGSQILTKEGKLDRKKLGSIIFSSPEKKRLLDNITHPKIWERVIDKVDKILKNNSNQVVLVDTPLLYETKSESFFNKIIVVYVPLEIQIKRLMNRDSLTFDEALKRINNQISIERKKEMADYVIDNSGTIYDTKKEVYKIFKILERLVKRIP